MNVLSTLRRLTFGAGVWSAPLIAPALAAAQTIPQTTIPQTTEAQTPEPSSAVSSSTAAVFKRYSPGVVKVQVTENNSSAKAGLGSGFFVDSSGTVVTNYHVIAQLINQPDRYHAEVLDVRGQTHRVIVAAVDVVHDLAVLQTPPHAPMRPAQWLSLELTPLEQGDRLYSMGHPRDLGLSVVEGTYNGLLEHTLYPKIHFTGSMNSGMSGGPAITGTGRVVGVNVASAGNGIGFLVPIAKVRELVAQVAREGAGARGHLRDVVAEQIRAYQEVYLEGMFSEKSPRVQMGKYSLPTTPAPFFKCWGDSRPRADADYVTSMHRCSTDDAIFLSDDQWSGVVEIEHQLFTSSTLGATRFAALLSSQFGDAYFGLYNNDEYVSRFKCQTHNVANGTAKMRVAFCARAYKHLTGLYDAVVHLVTLGSSSTGVISTLKLSGVTFPNAQKLAGRYVRSVTWNR